MKTPRIVPPVRIDARTRHLVAASIDTALKNFCQDHFAYIEERIVTKLQALRHSSTHWVLELWAAAAALHLMLRDHNSGIISLPPNVHLLVGVALHHLVNPFDVIPDHIAGDGHIDDALVMNYCISKIHNHAPVLLTRYLLRASNSDSSCP